MVMTDQLFELDEELRPLLGDPRPVVRTRSITIVTDIPTRISNSPTSRSWRSAVTLRSSRGSSTPLNIVATPGEESPREADPRARRGRPIAGESLICGDEAPW